MAISCPGRLKEPGPGEFSCSRGLACLVADLYRNADVPRSVAQDQEIRDSHKDRGAPAWLTDEDAGDA